MSKGANVKKRIVVKAWAVIEPAHEQVWDVYTYGKSGSYSESQYAKDAGAKLIRSAGDTKLKLVYCTVTISYSTGESKRTLGSTTNHRSISPMQRSG
jgi:hypothetical protein